MPRPVLHDASHCYWTCVALSDQPCRAARVALVLLWGQRKGAWNAREPQAVAHYELLAPAVS